MAKEFQVTSAVIRVSANRLMEEGRYASLEVTGILPGCRKNVKISASPGYMAIHCRPLFGYSGSAAIHPDQWRQLIEEAPIVSCRVLPYTITPEVEAWARAEMLRGVDCPAVLDGKDVHPNVKANRSWTHLVRRATALPVTE